MLSVNTCVRHQRNILYNRLNQRYGKSSLAASSSTVRTQQSEHGKVQDSCCLGVRTDFSRTNFGQRTFSTTVGIIPPSSTYAVGIWNLSIYQDSLCDLSKNNRKCFSSSSSSPAKKRDLELTSYSYYNPPIIGHRSYNVSSHHVFSNRSHRFHDGRYFHNHVSMNGVLPSVHFSQHDERGEDTFQNKPSIRAFSTDAASGGTKSGTSGASMKSSSTTTSSSTTKSKESTGIASDMTLNASAISKKVASLLKSLSKTIVSILKKTPGVLYFYMTNPKAFKEKMSEWKEIIQKEIHHYRMGSKLLAADLRTAKAMLHRSLSGSVLTRRERKQLLRTTSDLFRLVPMSMFVLIPFMELALPFALALFPNMLPSTFQDSLKAEENMKRELKSRIAMAGFFQEVLQSMVKEQIKEPKQGNDSNPDDSNSTSPVQPGVDDEEDTASKLLQFLDKARSGEMIPSDSIIRFAKYFEDELTLDNLPRTQLVNLCKYMSIPGYGSDAFLRFQLRHRIRSLKEDDQRILWEGIDSLTKMELREACQERGMRSTGLSKNAYKQSLQQWLDLSVNKDVPLSLLIMSRTFFLREEMWSREASESDETKSVAGIADAISAMDKDVVNQIVLEVATNEEKSQNPDIVKLSLDVLEQENELIEEEYEERQKALKKKLADEDELVAKKKKDKEEDISVEEHTGEEKEDTKGKTMKKKEVNFAAELKEAELKEKQLKQTKSAEAIDLIDQPEVGIADLSEGARIVSKEEILQGERQAEAFTAATNDIAAGTEAITETISTVGEEKEEEEIELSAEEMEAISQLISPDPVQSERKELQRIRAAIIEKDKSASADQVAVDLDLLSTNVDKRDDTQAKEPLPTKPDIAVKLNVQEKPAEAATATKVSDLPMGSEETDARASEIIEKEDAEAAKEADDSTVFDMDGGASVKELPSETEKSSMDKTTARLKAKLEKMVDNIEAKLEKAELKIGNKMHFLDKDMDGILSSEEVAQCLQLVLRRKLTFEEAMAIAGDMDENEDGFFTVAELTRWLETNKIVKLAEEGRDAEVDRAIAKAKMNETSSSNPPLTEDSDDSKVDSTTESLSLDGKKAK